MKTRNASNSNLVSGYGIFIPEKFAIDLITNFHNDTPFIKVDPPKNLTDDAARGIIKFFLTDCKIVTPDEFITVTLDYLNTGISKTFSGEDIPRGLFISSVLQEPRKDTGIPYTSIGAMASEYINRLENDLPEIYGGYNFEHALVHFKGLTRKYNTKNIKDKRNNYEIHVKYENIAHCGGAFNIAGIPKSDTNIYMVEVMNNINVFNLGYAYVTSKGNIRKEVSDYNTFFIKARKLNILIYDIISIAIKKIYSNHESMLERDYSISGSPRYSIDWDHENHTITLKYGDIYTAVFRYEKIVSDYKYKSIKDDATITNQIKRPSNAIDSVLGAIYNNPVLPPDDEDETEINITDYLNSIRIEGETLNKVSITYESLDKSSNDCARVDASEAEDYLEPYDVVNEAFNNLKKDIKD